MAFFPLLTSPPVSFPIFPQAFGLFHHALGSALTTMRLGPPQQASSTPVSRSSPSTLGAHPLSFSPLPSPQVSPSSPHQPPVFASLPVPAPLLPSLPALLASSHSLLLHLRQVAQCSVPCPFLGDIACHYVSLCRALVSLSPPSLLFPSATGESTKLRSRSFHYNHHFPLLVAVISQTFYLSPRIVVRTAPKMRPGGPEPLLPPDHYGCVLGCERFTGTLAAVEEHDALIGSIVSFPKVCNATSWATKTS